MNIVSLDEENNYWSRGYKFIAGVDEAGRGPLAGPLVCSSVIFKKNTPLINKINDSKKISKKLREELFPQICSYAQSISISVVEEKIIDKINIYQATIFGMKNCIYMLSHQPDIVLVDGMDIDLNDHIECKKIIKGDSKVMCIAAASIIAKVIRDNIMELYHIKYPGFKFNKNFGYPTKFHIEAINKYGFLNIHRKSFNPVKSMLR